ncbi:MAG TPA: 30S ribosome-binding factor RbfA [Acidimicrobiales bacterium]|nr:30S ribosome-binding factor RbfA [Acidimicrobiales bacterium]
MTPRESGRTNARRYPRTARLDRLVQAVVADSLERNDDDRLGLVTVTGVHVDPDMRHAVVFYTTRENTGGDTAEALEEARISVQRDIGREVRMKRTPQLRFERDPAMDAGWRIEAILKQERERAGE